MAVQKALIDQDSIVQLQKIIRSLSPKKVFLFRGKRSYDYCGAKDLIDKVFSTEGTEISEWQDFQENPKIEDVEKGLTLLRKFNADIIIAIGGGSVLDMAKLIRFAYSYEGNLTGKVFEKKEHLIPLVAIPTTAGTGCEATPFAVCYEDKVKYSVAHPDMLPDIAVVYPPLTYSNSSYLTACTGFDALAQATEAYWNVNATTESDLFAEEAIELLWHNIFKTVTQPTPESRAAMSKGAYLAGKAIAITKTTAPHAFSYAFTTYCGYPHGHAVALTFPFFFDLNVCRFKGKLQQGIDENHYESKMQKLRLIFGVDTATARNKIRTLTETLGLYNNGFKGANIHDLLAKVNIQRLDNNPVVMTKHFTTKLGNYLIP